MKYRFGSIIALPISIQKYSQKVAGIVSSPELILHPGTSRADDPGSALIVSSFTLQRQLCLRIAMDASNYDKWWTCQAYKNANTE